MKQTWESTPIAEATEAALRPFQGESGRISVSGPMILLTPSATITLTLGLHELATNAAKYGALSNRTGAVDVSWSIDGERLALIWREREGPPVAPPEKTGFGTRLLERAVASDLGGTVTLQFEPGGLVCTICAPLARVAP